MGATRRCSPRFPTEAGATSRRFSTATGCSSTDSSSAAPPPTSLGEEVAAAMQPPLAAVDVSESVDQVFSDLRGQSPAVVVAREGRPLAVLTRSDPLEYLPPR